MTDQDRIRTLESELVQLRRDAMGADRLLAFYIGILAGKDAPDLKVTLDQTVTSPDLHEWLTGINDQMQAGRSAI